MVGAPSLPVTLEEEQSPGSHITSLSEPGFSNSIHRDHALVPSVEVFCTMLWCTCLLLYGVDIATSSISDKTPTTSITRGVGVISRSEWTHLPSQPRSIPCQSVLWSE